uniref:Cytoplasmic dynein 2 light intermediate chain 1 n=1 Tax=Bursaphelenchus xylophilus TaxID=6326 RepID=A0A1I7RTV0_BURXY
MAFVDIFEKGIEALKKQKEESAQEKDRFKDEFNKIRTIFVCGMAKSGKTSFINRYFDRNENSEPTFGLSYRFATKTRVNTKELVEFWELGNSALLSSLTSVCITEKNISGLSTIIFIDPTIPQNIEAVIAPLLTSIRDQVAKIKGEKPKFDMSKSIFYIGIPCVMVIGRYDEFQNFDTERKRTILKLLRFLAHVNGATLMSYSIYQEILVGRGKSLAGNLGFDTAFNVQNSTDILKPVFVEAGSDSIEDIGDLINGRQRATFDSIRDAMDFFLQSLNEHFKQEVGETIYNIFRQFKS